MLPTSPRTSAVTRSTWSSCSWRSRRNSRTKLVVRFLKITPRGSRPTVTCSTTSLPAAPQSQQRVNMKIEVFHGKVRKAKSKIWKPEWYFRFQGGNNRNQGGGGEGYKKLASAVNAVESILAKVKAAFK